MYFWSQWYHNSVRWQCFFCQFQHLTVGVSAHWNGVEKHSLLTEKKHLLEKKRREGKNRMGCNSPECIPPHVSSTVFFGRLGNTQESTGIQFSLPEHKGKHLSLEFGLQRVIGGFHITTGKIIASISIGLLCWCKLYGLKWFCKVLHYFRRCYDCATRLSKTFGDQAREQERQSVVITRHFLSSFLRLPCTFSHSPRLLQHWAGRAKAPWTVHLG